jgi:hypothetical protein
MLQLHCKYIKIVAANGDLDAAAEIGLTKDVVSVKADAVIVEHILSTNPNPADRFEIGSKFEIKGILADPSLANYVIFFGGVQNSNVYTKTQGIRTLGKYDIRLGVYRNDGLIIERNYTDMEFTAPQEQAFEMGKMTYLPFAAMSTSTTEETIDNSAA